MVKKNTMTKTDATKSPPLNPGRGQLARQVPGIKGNQLLWNGFMLKTLLARIFAT